MPIVDTREFARIKKRKNRRSPFVFVTVFLLLLGGMGLYIFASKRNTPSASQEQASALHEQHQAESSKTQLKIFTPQEFNSLALSIKYPNTQLFELPPSITGDKTADARIRKLAEARGYRLTSIPVGPIQKINEPRLENDDLLQPLAAESWKSLKAAAVRDGLPLSLTSAYRSPEYQRNLFMSRLHARGATVAQIIAGGADSVIESVLTQAAAPGYSRHHTGYTIDLWCEDGSKAFLLSTCYRWISTDNYKVAKEHGWIPSYPEGVELQGPEPEPWEYVWVGEELVTD